jgi:hypothetical protein
MEEKVDSKQTISRREMLRNIGIAGAVVWAAPVLMSLPAEAATDSAKKKCKKSCKNKPADCNEGFNPCSSQTNCPSPVGDGAYCFTTTEGKKRCAADQFCSQVPSCNSSADCVAGSVCIISNGCNGCASGPPGVCVPICTKCKLSVGDDSRKPFRQAGRTLTGR